jgi:hypothetical protein
LADARTLLILAVRFGAGCVLRTASVSISRNSALVGGLEAFVIGPCSPLFLFGIRGFPGQALSPQSFVVFLEGFLRFFVFRCRLSLIGSLKSLSGLSFRVPYFVAHGSPPISSDRSDDDSATPARRKETR